MSQRQATTSAAIPHYAAFLADEVASDSAAAPQTDSIREPQTGRASASIPIVDAIRRKILAEITHTDAVLASQVDRWSVRRLDDEAGARIADSVAGDRDMLAGLADGVRAATSRSGLLEIASLARQIRPEAYSIAVGQLQDLAALTEAAEANARRLAILNEVVVKTERFAEMTAVVTDLATARLLNSKAAVAERAARDAALMLSANSTRNEIQAVTGQVLRLEVLLDRIDQIITLVELDLAVARREHAPGA